ncbi:nucleotide sugar dehydrogenase [Sporichthya sp.]|uniref:nucleotide sugar dehydrogenase n=1 Tax=Sporichthya sp. TaxID=65475 RepID=UPI00178DC059|nr:nucleotide sugar dehydrogenase [Sporichthya sp.]MBA3743526.1 nucleotide sugar dehydrogenase [Sporichthya sp.]
MSGFKYDLGVIGLGYVGLPLVVEAVAAGMRVAGIDASERKVTSLLAGQSHVDDISEAQVAHLLANGFHPTTSPDVVGDCETVVICVPTPLDDDRRPDLGAVNAATAAIAAKLRPGQLVVLESTTWPGTTRDVLLPALEATGLKAGTDFYLAFSPERIDPGNPTFGLRNTPKVVGGHTVACRDRAVGFYGKIVDTVVPVKGTAEAEMAKLLENTYRHVNIALVNEMAMFSNELGIDLWSAIDAAATKPFGFQAFRPGPGVGGHCIPIDPNYLSHAVRKLGYPFHFVELAQEVNERMPVYVSQRATRILNTVRKAVNGSNILLLGVTYKPDIADERETPALPLVRRLRALGANVTYCDPHVPAWAVDGKPVTKVDDLVTGVTEADLSIMLAPHKAFDLDVIASRGKLVLDTRGVLTASDTVERL